MALPSLKVEIAFGDIPLTTNALATWEDVSAYVRGNPGDYLDVKRGRRSEFGDIEPSTATVILNNYDRRFDPNDSTSPYFGDIKPMVKIRIAAVWSATTYYLFTGYVEGWSVEYEGGTITTATLTCVDSFKYFNLCELTDFSRAQETSGDRIDAILDEVAWPAAERVTAVGDIDVVVEVVTKVSALSQLRRVADAERGLFFVNGAGHTVFQDRSYRNTLLSTGTWTNSGAPGDYSYADFLWRDDDSSIWNDIRVTRSGGIEQTSDDATSIADFFRRTLPLTNLPLVDDAAALDTADWTLAQFKDARVRPDIMTIDPAVNNDWAVVLALDITDVMEIDRTTLDILAPDGSVAIAGFTTSLNAHIEGIQWRISNGGALWKLTLYLSPSFVITPVAGTQNTTDDWIVPTVPYDNGWVDYGSPYQTAGYRKEGEWVYLRGMIKDGTVGAVNGTAFTLPEGYRPQNDQKFPVVADHDIGEVQVRPAGYVVMLTGSNVFFDLSSISFRVI